MAPTTVRRTGVHRPHLPHHERIIVEPRVSSGASQPVAGHSEADLDSADLGQRCEAGSRLLCLDVSGQALHPVAEHGLHLAPRERSQESGHRTEVSVYYRRQPRPLGHRLEGP